MSDPVDAWLLTQRDRTDGLRAPPTLVHRLEQIPTRRSFAAIGQSAVLVAAGLAVLVAVSFGPIQRLTVEPQELLRERVLAECGLTVRVPVGSRFEVLVSVQVTDDGRFVVKKLSGDVLNPALSECVGRVTHTLRTPGQAGRYEVVVRGPILTH